MKNKFFEWLGNLNYAQAMKIYLLIVFGWNSWLYIVWIYAFGGKRAIAVLGGVLVLVSVLLLIKERWELLLGLATIIISIIIGLLLLKYSPFALGYYTVITMLIAGILLMLCALKAIEIPHKKRKEMLVMGIGMIVLSMISITSILIFI